MEVFEIEYGEEGQFDKEMVKVFMNELNNEIMKE